MSNFRENSPTREIIKAIADLRIKKPMEEPLEQVAKAQAALASGDLDTSQELLQSSISKIQKIKDQQQSEILPAFTSVGRTLLSALEMYGLDEDTSVAINEQIFVRLLALLQVLQDEDSSPETPSPTDKKLGVHDTQVPAVGSEGESTDLPGTEDVKRPQIEVLEKGLFSLNGSEIKFTKPDRNFGYAVLVRLLQGPRTSQEVETAYQEAGGKITLSHHNIIRDLNNKLGPIIEVSKTPDGFVYSVNADVENLQLIVQQPKEPEAGLLEIKKKS